MLLTALIVLGMFYTTSSRATLIETTAFTVRTTLGQFAISPDLTSNKLTDGVISNSPLCSCLVVIKLHETSTSCRHQ